ncbi:MAG: hypothetical protein KKG09_01240 [Verrucomicrobia bacterium]|nr:hypothetical protein [Verrucomicrobiota bacterium]MBU4496617.1 hypothetical protein [Verrucomicrobiota bacterium]MCG2679658.1 hypothetical protein [Kiritimatiellia bacterium]
MADSFSSPVYSGTRWSQLSAWEIKNRSAFQSAKRFRSTNGYYALSYTNTAGTNWLTPAPSSATITNSTSRVDIVYSTTGLAAGTYTGQVAITGFDSTFGFTAANSPQTFTVVMEVMELTLSTTVMTNSVMFGGNASPQSFSISNTGGGSFNYTNTSLTNWITVAPAAGALSAGVSQVITNTYPTASLGLGTHTGIVEVASTSGGGATQTVSVIMQVMDLQAPLGLTNNVMKGHSSSQTFNVANLGGGELSYTIGTNSYDWVSLSQTNGVLTNASSQTITVNYAPNLPTGVTTGFLTVASSSGGGVTQDVSLTVNVSDLWRDPGGLTNTIMPGYVPPDQSFVLVNTGAGTIDYLVASDANWVTPAPTNGALGSGQTNTITLTYGSTTNWQVGTSNATVTVFSTNGGGATQTVAIVFYVVELMPPSGVTASKGTYADKIRVTWTAVSNALGYQVWRNMASDTTTASNLVATTDTVYDDTTALQDVTYYYWLKSTNSQGVSAFSVSDTGTRSMGVPPAPTGVIASDGTYTDRVAVAWQAAQGAIGYEVWRNLAMDSNTATKISSPDPTGMSYNDISAAGVRYYYWVKSKGSNDLTSAFSAPDTGWRALSASGITASEGLRREIRITWDEVSGATRYELWRNRVEDLASAELLTNGTVIIAYRDLNVEPSIIYFYWVKAVCDLETKISGPDTGWCSGRKWDFSGDGRADAWYYSASGGRWYVVPTSNVVHTVVFGGVGMVAVPDDYDGDGKSDPAVYEESSGTWMVMMSASGYAIESAGAFGASGYTAVPGDYDGDGKADPAIYEETMGAWYALLSGSGYAMESAIGFGAPGYRAVPADYDGDGKTDPAVYQESFGNWFLMLSSSGYVPQYVHFGASGYAPVPGEYTGLGLADIAVYHEASGYWYILSGMDESEPAISVQFGAPGYAPISADYDGDGFDDVAVFYRDRHDALWYLRKSREGFQIISGREHRP